MLLTDQQWRLLQPHFPPPPRGARGRPPVDNRPILEAILYKLSTHTPWYDLAPPHPSYQTCYRYYRRWHRSGFLYHTFRLLYADLRDRGGLDLQQALHDGRLAATFYRRRLHLTTYDPTLRGTWQLTTALLILPLIEQPRPEP
ncbi:MAG: transposase [Anaerolineales bacterium]|nr:transposase [Anaerolineales bacterium]